MVQYSRRVRVAALGLFAVGASAASASVYQSYAESALTQLQTYYDNSTGLWTSYGVSWWQSANALTTLANMVSLNSSAAQQVADFVFPNTFTEAAAFNQARNHNTKRHVKRQQTPWTNNFYDDEGWWAMGWIRAYDVTGTEDYLNAAEGLFQDMTNGWGTNCSSQGLWWDKSHQQINPIANMLFMEVAATLANRVSSKQSYYVGWAEKEWNWFQTSGMWNASQNLIAGSIDTTSCQPMGTNQPGATYTQGSLIQALTELSVATGNSSYLDQAYKVALAVMNNSAFNINGVLTEPHIDQAHPGNSAPQFKGVFMRGLMRFLELQSDDSLANFAATSADSIWANDRQDTASLGPDWSGPVYTPINASSQSSAMDGLVAAWSAAS